MEVDVIMEIIVIILFFAFYAAAFYVKFKLEDQLRAFKKEAVENGYAEWVVDDDSEGCTKFKWKHETDA